MHAKIMLLPGTAAGEKLRPLIRQIGGDEWGLMKALDRTINNVKTGVYRPKT